MNCSRLQGIASNYGKNCIAAEKHLACDWASGRIYSSFVECHGKRFQNFRV
jgi:hypothetical protein